MPLLPISARDYPYRSRNYDDLWVASHRHQASDGFPSSQPFRRPICSLRATESVEVPSDGTVA
jgi:hypothetical protein